MTRLRAYWIARRDGNAAAAGRSLGDAGAFVRMCVLEPLALNVTQTTA